MQLLDVNVLVYAFRRDSTEHAYFRRFVEGLMNAPEPFGVSDLVLSGFLRIVTNHKVFAHPDSLADALAFASALRSSPNCVVVSPSQRHWRLFVDLCAAAGAKGNLIPDAYHAALAIEHGCEWITTDRDFARFPGLRWRDPRPNSSPPPQQA